jgi:hypothetical protein
MVDRPFKAGLSSGPPISVRRVATIEIAPNTIIASLRDAGALGGYPIRGMNPPATVIASLHDAWDGAIITSVRDVAAFNGRRPLETLADEPPVAPSIP